MQLIAGPLTLAWNASARGRPASPTHRWAVQSRAGLSARRWPVPRMAQPSADQDRRRPAAAAEAVPRQRFAGKVVMFSSRCSSCVCLASVARRVRILARAGGFPASSPCTAESTTRTVYPSGVRFDSAGASGLLCPMGAPMAKTPARERMPNPQSGGRREIPLRK